MSEPAYHGKTHLPKSMGGTDPTFDSLPGAEAIEWARYAKLNASLGTSMTEVTFPDGTDEGEFDSGTPTFAINGSNRIQIGKDGSYVMHVQTYGWTLDPGVDTVLFLQVERITGPSPVYSRASFGAVPPIAIVPLRFNHAHVAGADDSDVKVFQMAEQDIEFVIKDGAIASAGAPCVLKLSAYIEEDGSGAAHSEGDFYVFVKRHGPTFTA